MGWGGSDHSKQYPEFAKEDYAKRALELVQKPLGENVLGYKNEQGQIIRYDKEMNGFVKGHTNQGINTMFKPKNDEKYYEKQEKENRNIQKNGRQSKMLELQSLRYIYRNGGKGLCISAHDVDGVKVKNIHALFAKNIHCNSRQYFILY